jgi:hypothetical protein
MQLARVGGALAPADPVLDPPLIDGAHRECKWVTELVYLV